MQSTMRFGDSTLVQHHSGSAIPKSHPSPQDIYQRKGAPICPSTASQGAKTLCICMTWLGDAVYGGLESQL